MRRSDNRGAVHCLYVCRAIAGHIWNVWNSSRFMRDAADQGCLASTLAGSIAQMSNTIAPDNALPVSRISQSNASNPKSRWDSEREVMLKCPQYGNASRLTKQSPSVHCSPRELS